MTESVVFVYQDFEQQFPELLFSESQAEMYFDLACGMLDNTYGSVVIKPCERKRLLYLLVAHIGTLFSRGADTVGNVASAHEGSVSVSMGSIGNNLPLYFGQTQYGLLFWQMTAQYRSGFWVC